MARQIIRGRPQPRVPLACLPYFAAGLGALVGYLATLAPTITWRHEGADSGDLVTAAFTLGIPHPSGYPLYTLTAAAFAHLPIGDPARSVNLFSALAACAAVGLLSFTARSMAPEAASAWVRSLAGASVALAFAFSPGFWSQANIAELYAFSSLFAVALLGVCLSRLRHRLPLAAGILGLGLAHHLTIVFLIPSALLLLWDTRWSRREWLAAGAFALAPLALYLYLPVRASMDPPINWGNPRTWGAFFWVVSGAAYHANLFNLSGAELLTRAAVTARFLFAQYQFWGIAVGVWGLVRMGTNPQSRVRRQFLALALAFTLFSGYAIAYNTRNSFVYLIPAYAIFALWIAFGLSDIMCGLTRKWMQPIIALSLLGFPLYNLIANYAEMDLSRDREALQYAEGVFGIIPSDSMVVTAEERSLFALWYYRYVLAANSSHVVIVHPALLQFDWYDDQVTRQIPLRETHSRSAHYLPRLETMIDQMLLDGRAVFVADDEPWLGDYAHKSVGALSIIQSRIR